MTTKRLMMEMTESEANAYDTWSMEDFPRLFGDVSGAEFTQRNKEFIEFGGRVDVAVGTHSEPAAHDKLQTAKTAAKLARSLPASKSSSAAIFQDLEAKKSSGIGFMGFFGKLALKPKRKDHTVQNQNSIRKLPKK